jgi:hypothetical protein
MNGDGEGDVGPEEAERRLERLADRLRVVGPRLGAREGDAAQQLLQEIRAGLQRLADLAADADSDADAEADAGADAVAGGAAAGPRRPVPVLAAHALADQALVLGYDVLDGPGRRSAAVRGAAVQTFRDVSRLI